MAGIHVQEDLGGEEGSWKCLFEEQEIEVSIEERSLGYFQGMVECFA